MVEDKVRPVALNGPQSGGNGLEELVGSRKMVGTTGSVVQVLLNAEDRAGPPYLRNYAINSLMTWPPNWESCL